MRSALKWTLGAAALLAAGAPNGGFAQGSGAATPVMLTYADVADLFASSPIVARVRVVSATRIEDARAQTRSAGTTRFLIEGEVQSLIRGTGAIPPRVRYLADIAPDSRGKSPKLKKAVVLIAALPVAGRAGEVQLTTRDAQQPWSAPLEAQVRDIVASVVAPGAAPPIAGIASAFHVTGSVTGEGETQIFLKTGTNAPISISVLSRPGEAKRWALALGEIVDEAAAVPARDTLAWYRLACTLPPVLPPDATGELGAAEADAARSDYAFVIESLGECTRTRR